MKRFLMFIFSVIVFLYPIKCFCSPLWDELVTMDATPATNDMFWVVDVSDTTDSTDGTLKKVASSYLGGVTEDTIESYIFDTDVETVPAEWDFTVNPLGDDDVVDTITVSNYLPLSGGTLTGNLSIDNGTGTSPLLRLVTTGAQILSWQLVGTETTITSPGQIDYALSGDANDYLVLKTVNNVPTIASSGDCNISITPDGGGTSITGTLAVSGALTAASIASNPSSTPGWTGRDSDCAVSSDGAKFYVNATTLDQSDEIYDWFFQSKINGTLQTWLEYDASDGAITLGEDASGEDLVMDLNKPTENVAELKSNTGLSSLLVTGFSISNMGQREVASYSPFTMTQQAIGGWIDVTDDSAEINLIDVATYATDASQSIFVVIYNSTSTTITVNPSDIDLIIREGTAQADGVSVTLGGGYGSFFGLASYPDGWKMFGVTGTAAQGS